MAGYCTGNCLGWDETSGKLTLETDPLGGTTCGVDGLKLKIAGNTTGVSVTAKNNGLFMTTAGEIATKQTPTRKSVVQTAASSNIAGAFAAPGTYGYASTGNIALTNPSAVYNMLAVVQWEFVYDFQIFGTTGNGSSVQVDGRFWYNGVYGLESSKKSAYNAGNYTFYDKMFHIEYFEVPPSTTYTFAGSQIWTAAGALQPQFYSAYTNVHAYGLVMENV